MIGMYHVSLTCKHHLHMRWSCKSIAWTDRFGYGGQRNLFYFGLAEGCTPEPECTCTIKDLIRAESLLPRQDNDPEVVRQS